MATRDPMDLHERSQAFYQSFYNFHLVNGDAWYIKDENHHYVDANLSFLKFDQTCSQTNQVDAMHRVFSGLEGELKKYELSSVNDRRVVNLLVVTKCESSNEFSLHKLGISPCSNGTITIINEFDLMGWDGKVVELLGVKIKYQLGNSSLLEKFVGINPFSILSDSEKITAWFMAVGFSKRLIATTLKISESAVDKKVSNIYIKLKLKNYENFMFLSGFFRWTRFIPKALLNKQKIISMD